MKYSIYTTGCRSNQYDSWVMDEKMKEAGFTRSNPESADIVIINACTVTESAERDLRRYISRIRRTNNKAKIVLAGCHAQAYPEKNFGADLMLGQKEKFEIVNYLHGAGTFVDEEIDGFLDEIPSHFSLGPRTRFFLKIQDGCDKYCAYCIVPFARGKPRSRPVQEILKIMRELKEKGIKEVVISGIEIASYYDGFQRTDLKGLLKILEESDTPSRIRLSSIDPLFIDQEFISIFSSSKKLARSLHIPLQSGCDSILQAMGRKYEAEIVKDIIEELKKKVEGIGIGLDIIVGFPGEGEREFLETLRFIESLDVYYLHIFPFSPRHRTLASKMADQIGDEERKRRVKMLKEIDKRKRLAFYERHLGRILNVVPEKKVYEGGYVRGFSENYIPVFIPSEDGIINRLFEVKVREIKGGKVFGERTG
jgi:threonylcarbamoyladenosine tRNA methylthiotransferase MtaB